ncbi:response regulator transcription factor [Neptunicella marina]|uniref:Response regulator transcription factor n=2 Tax=Neptunicella marina TaxID=2125989 RepID=A0A8J6LY23_9ALTE|nr:response regulator transcription factor [Neptunicella marina]
MMQRILVIDDEPQIRRFIRISLTAENFEFLEATTAAEGLEIASTEKPDLIVLDLGLPDQDGFKVLKRLREWTNVPVLILTARDAEEEKVKLLVGGANDYLSKPFGIKELIARIKVLLRDLTDNQQEKTILEFRDLRIDIPNHQAWIHDEKLSLSRKEFAMLSFLASHPDQLVTQQQLLEKIWGASHSGDTHYLRIFVSLLRKKLNDDPDNPSFIKTEPGVGYRFVQPAIETEA